MPVRIWMAALALCGSAITAQAQQSGSGQFTTAAEIRPILEATRGNWVAVREYEGQDWLYVTHLWSWRCGMSGIAVGLNGEKPTLWPMPPCHYDYATPSVLLDEDGLPARTHPLGSIQQIDVLLLLNDGTSMKETFQRNAVRIP